MLSHYPKKELSQHIDEVKLGVEFLTSFHSKKTLSNLKSELMDYIIRFHDEGKKSKFFQEYIKQPEKYNGDPLLKSHSKLSALLASTKYLKEPKQLFRVLQCIGGHHTQILTLSDMINYWLDGEYYLKKQILSLSFVPDDIDTRHPSDKINDLLEDYVGDQINEQSLEAAVCYRIITQFMFSLLLEADKALLIASIEKHLSFERHKWSTEWISNRIGKPSKTKMNSLRNQIREEIQKYNGNESIYTLTSPTGSGKTLLSATWALKQREKLLSKVLITPKIIIVLPFLSVIDQTVNEYFKILKMGGIEPDGSWLIASHSLSDRKFNSGLEENEEGFFIDAWRSDVIITTYDQFLYSIFNPKTKYQMRFHNLFDSVIIIDEVQSIPAKLWKSLEGIIKIITSVSESKILLMSATLPSFISQSVPLLTNYRHYFSLMNRYTIDFSDIKNNVVMKLDEFSNDMVLKIPQWIKNNDHVLITLNTRNSAQKIFKDIQKYINDSDIKCSLFFISSDVIPKDRLDRIDGIKGFSNKKEPCIVVSTQCVEAGVDIDMTIVIRDFAPLDSIIQIAGRCNRHGNRKNGHIIIVQIISNGGKLYSEMIYDEIHLQKTRSILKMHDYVSEIDIIHLTDKYFEELMGSDGISQGNDVYQSFAYFRDFTPIRELLRGKEIQKIDFVLLEGDQKLKDEIYRISQITNKWIRREQWRRLSGSISNLTISVIAKHGFNPEEVAEQFHGLWLLDKNYYDDDMGFFYPQESASCRVY